ncbi:MAG TPA: hypothetical protein VGC56_17590 [Allosphingosinicella sp.]
MTLPFLTAAIVAMAPSPPVEQAPAPARAPESYVTFVGMSSKRCVFMTGDVLFDARQFRKDLKDGFDRADGIIIYHEPNVRPACLATARRIVRELGFTVTAIEEAPKDLDMGPPR